MKIFGYGLLRGLSLAVRPCMSLLLLYLVHIAFLNSCGVFFFGFVIVFILLFMKLFRDFGERCLGLVFDPVSNPSDEGENK